MLLLNAYSVRSSDTAKLYSLINFRRHQNKQLGSSIFCRFLLFLLQHNLLDSTFLRFFRLGVSSCNSGVLWEQKRSLIISFIFPYILTNVSQIRRSPSPDLKMHSAMLLAESSYIWTVWIHWTSSTEHVLKDAFWVRFHWWDKSYLFQ